MEDAWKRGLSCGSDTWAARPILFEWLRPAWNAWAICSRFRAPSMGVAQSISPAAVCEWLRSTEVHDEYHADIVWGVMILDDEFLNPTPPEG